MPPKANTEPLARLAPYIPELREFFADCGLSAGSAAALGPLAEELTNSASFHEEFTSMLRAVILCEGGVLPRNELLELVLVAISGSGVDRSGDDEEWAVDVLFKFAGEVIRSLKAATQEGEEQVGGAEPSRPRPARLPAPRPSLPPLAAKRPVLEKAEALSPLTWTFNRFPDLPPSPVSEDTRMVAPERDVYIPQPAPRPQPPREPVAKPVARPVAPRPIVPPSPPQPAASPVLRPVLPQPVARPTPPPPSRPQTVALQPVHIAPVAPRRNHLFRNTMLALLVLLAAMLLWRHWHPVQDTEDAAVTSSSSPSSAPGGEKGTSGAASPQPEAPKPLSASDRALLEARRQAGLDPSLNSKPGPDTPLPSAMAQTPLPSPASQSTQAGEQSSPWRRRQSLTAASAPSTPAAASAGQSPAGKVSPTIVPPEVMAGYLIASPPPKYPRMANLTGLEGKVVLQALISRYGTVTSTHVVDGHHLLRGAAVHAVRNWRYRPYLVNGKPVDVSTTITVDFHFSL